MIRVNAVKVPLDHELECRGGMVHTGGVLFGCVAKACGIDRACVRTVEVLRRSVDARRKSNVHFSVNVAVQLADQVLEQALAAAGKAQAFKPYEPLEIPAVTPDALPPVVVGTGPAGLFAALYLARAGLRPIVLERGFDVDARAQAVAAFEASGPLDPECNVQFGEGGAGTFSDGKLTTGIKHPFAAHVLHWFAEAGAPEEVLWDARPHIGSDKLPGVVAAMRNEIVELGGQVRFATRLTDVAFEGGRLESVQVADASGARWMPARALVLACGHSARDTFRMLLERGVAMVPKPFSVGVRIEHPQDLVNMAQWGAAAGHEALGAAEYKLAWQGEVVAHAGAQARAYTFCMCPGGQVMCAASEEGGVVTNGMSPYARDGANANAGLLVNVDGRDFADGGVLAGMEYQRGIEQAAFKAALAAGGAPYQAPAQTVGEFLNGGSGTPSTLVQPSYARGIVWCNLHDVLPTRVCQVLNQALPALDAKMHGFAHPQAVLTAPETRSSSPVRIGANASRQAVLVQQAACDDASLANAAGCGIYPCGEGAGLAGGIMSAACNGLDVARQVAADQSGLP